MNNKLVYMVAAASLLVGGIGSIAAQSFAQDTNVTTALQTQTQATTAPGVGMGNHGHRPLGNDGIVASINGNTIVMAEEADEGGASYTVDASAAIITNNGAAAKISDIKVGDKIFVDGTPAGTTVKATAVFLGHPGFHNEANEPAGTPETNDDGATGTTTN